MLQDRKLKWDLFSIVLLGAILFLAASLVTYSPADPVAQLPGPLRQFYQYDQLVFPLNTAPQNACGWSGSTVADILYSTLGIGAFYLVAGLVAVVITLFRSQRIGSPLMRSTGWALSLVGIVSLAHMVCPQLTVGPVIGPGGYLGALGCGLLNVHFAFAGGLIIAIAVMVVGLMMWTEYALAHFLATIAKRISFPSLPSFRLPWKFNANGHRSTATPEPDVDEDDLEHVIAISQRRARRNDLQAGLALQNDSNGLNQKDEISTIPFESALDEDELEWSEDDEIDEEDESPIPVVVKTAAKTVAPENVDDEAQTNDENPASAVVKGPHFKVSKKSKDSSADNDDVRKQLDKAAIIESHVDYDLPGIDLLIKADEVSYDEQEREALRNAKILEKTFLEFGFKVKVVAVETGPVIAQYELQLESGLRLAKITGLSDDLAIALRVPSVRIVAPIPGKNTVGIEVPNETRQVVRLREVMEEAANKHQKMKIPIFLGKDVAGDPMVVDLATMPHLLIAGRTGTGKSVCLNAIICSMLMTRRPDEVRMLMIDPKMVELSGYGRLPHLMHPVVTDMRKAEAILAWAVDKMEERYALLAKAGVRHVTSYNQLGEDELYDRLKPETDEEWEMIPRTLPFIVIVADEMADLMMTAGKEVEQSIIRLAQKSRAVGIHLILATQKPTVDVITGLIKSNLPARIAFQVASRTDSRVVLDEMGADKLLGNGDMLFLWPGTSTLIRGQGTYLSDDEIDAVTNAVSTGEQEFVHELLSIKVDEQQEAPESKQLKNRDDLYEDAVDIVVKEERGSVSLLQRALGIGYGRAARLIDFMEEDEIVGAYAGSKSREVLISVAQWEAMRKGKGNDSSTDSSTDDNEFVTHTSENRSSASVKPPKKKQQKAVEPEDYEEPEDDFEEDEEETEYEEWVDEEDEAEEEYDD
jgi:DNA segregation ATPase FtsK/SpoIIIE, S-DNA-T family